MKKKQLSKAPLKPANNRLLYLAKRTVGIEYFFSCEYHKTKEERMLILNIYTTKDLLEKKQFPRYRVFFTKKEYITQYFENETAFTWKTACLDHILNYKWCHTVACTSMKDNKKIQTFFKIKEKNSFSSNDTVFSKIRTFQTNIMEQRLYKKHQKEKYEIDNKMQEVKNVPRNFQKWCDKSALFQSRYIFYHHRNKEKGVKGYCTYCRKEVIVYGPRHNQAGICPHCNKNITYKVIGRSRNIVDYTNIALLQKTNNGFVIRYFYVYKKYGTNFKNAEISFFEEIRTFYEGTKQHCFLWGNFKKTGNYRWCNTNVPIYLIDTVIYPKGIKEVLQDTLWKYSGLDLYLEQNSESFLDVGVYLSKSLRQQYLEKLVKCRLFRLVQEQTCSRFLYAFSNIHVRNILSTNEQELHKVLNIRKQYLNMAIEYNISSEQLVLLQKISKTNISITKEDFINYIQIFGYDTRPLKWTRYKTLYKMKKYMTEQQRKGMEKKVILDLWDDYLKACNELGDNLKNSFLFFPKRLKQAHDRAMERLQIKKETEKRLKHQELVKQFQENYETWNKKWFWQNQDYAILVPRCEEELIKEGIALHICVGQNHYFDKMAQGKSIILFLRKRTELQAPFYTLEVQNGKIVQCYGKNHKTATAEIENILKKFQKKKRKYFQEQVIS